MDSNNAQAFELVQDLPETAFREAHVMRQRILRGVFTLTEDYQEQLFLGRQGGRDNTLAVMGLVPQGILIVQNLVRQ